MDINTFKSKESLHFFPKSFHQEIEDDKKKLKDIPSAWTGKINFVKMSIISKPI